MTSSVALAVDAPSSPLEGAGILGALSGAEIAAIQETSRRLDFPPDSVLFAEGDPPDWLFIVVAGFVKLVKHSEDGRDIILHVALPGELVGGVSAFGKRPHPFTAQAMVPLIALRCAGPSYAAVMAAHPAIARWTIDELVERLVEAHETMKSLAVERVDRRIARQLLKLSHRVGRPRSGGVEIGLPLSRQDIADMAGTTVETAIRVLSRWRRGGIVLTVDGRLVVADLDRLSRLAETGSGV